MLRSKSALKTMRIQVILSYYLHAVYLLRIQAVTAPLLQQPTRLYTQTADSTSTTRSMFQIRSKTQNLPLDETQDNYNKCEKLVQV